MGKSKKPAKGKSPPRTRKTSGRRQTATPKPARPKPVTSKPGPPARGGPANLHALLIACNCYLPNLLAEGTYPSLGGCVRDVEHVEQFLRRRLGLSDERLIKLTSTDNGREEPREPPQRRPTYENMVAAFQKVTDLTAKGDQVYIHYSGHGGRTPTIVPKLKGP
ncbi:MAG TPA: caspase family protein, partial [Gemmataceae bacterium]|nr:caspase family protein [Gemmataceae bacterium]